MSSDCSLSSLISTSPFELSVSSSTFLSSLSEGSLESSSDCVSGLFFLFRVTVGGLVEVIQIVTVLVKFLQLVLLEEVGMGCVKRILTYQVPYYDEVQRIKIIARMFENCV